MLPILDFTPFSTDDHPGQQRVAAELRRACEQAGFFYLTGHGLSGELVEAMMAQASQFFARPLEQKQRLAWAGVHSNQGYVALGQESLDQAQPGDLKEALNIVGKPTVEDPRDGFQMTTAEFFARCSQVAERVLQAFAIALSLPDAYFLDRHHTQDYTLRLLHYPPLATAPQPGQLRAGSHSDYGSLTLLFQDHQGGLEVQPPGNAWMPVEPRPGAVVVNTGDLMERWTNGCFPSTRHRVVLNQATASRQALAFFCQPDPEVEVACLPSCSGPDTPLRYAPVAAGQYLRSRLQATYCSGPAGEDNAIG